MSRRFAVLDRDGTIIHERNYLSDPAQVELLPGATQGLRRLAELGYGLVVVTNQSGVGRKYFDIATVDAVHGRLRELLAAEGVRLDAIYVCPHTPADECECRKPRPGLLHQAAKELGFAPADCIVIGDKACDVDLGRAVGARTFLVRTGYGAKEEAAGTAADYVVDDLAAVAVMLAATHAA